MNAQLEVIISFKYKIIFESNVFEDKRRSQVAKDNNYNKDLYFNSVITLINIQRLAIENNLLTFNITKRF